MRFYGTIQKVDRERREVAGYASTEAVDAHGEVVKKEAIEAALDDYLEYGNVREMHQLSAVGKAIEATIDERGLYLVAKIVDNAAWEKVVEGVYKGFSIGGKVLGRDSADKTVITKIRLDEISIVDRPSNPLTKFDLWRAAGGNEVVDLERRVASLLDETRKLGDGLRRIQRTLKASQKAPPPVIDGAAMRAADQAVTAFGEAVEQAQDSLAELSIVEKTVASDPLARAHDALDRAAQISEPDPSDIILKAIAGKDAEIDRLNKRIEQLLEEPLPAKCAGSHALIAISKEDDANGNLRKTAPNTDDLAAALEALPPEGRALLLTKAALQMPRRATMVPIR
jgi:phage head maturation protease